MANIAFQLRNAFEQLAPKYGITLSLRTPNGSRAIVDVSESELSENPLLDRYDVIQAAHVRLILPEELPEADLDKFFKRTDSGWLPFAAGLPWRRVPGATDRMLALLRSAASDGPSADRVVKVVSEPGAGGTTLARQLAFAAACEGFPTLVAKQVQFRPALTELSRFMLRVREQILSRISDADRAAALDSARALAEVPWLVVFDVHHWKGREADLLSLARSLGAERRNAVILVVSESPEAEPLQSVRDVGGRTLTHDLSREEALALGEHLNQFLKSSNSERPLSEWESFWQSHSPRIGSFGRDAQAASFWVALEFWLKRQVDLGQSIRSWLYNQFQCAAMSPEVRRAVLQVAALGIERLGLPLELVPASGPGEHPYSYQFAESRLACPAIGLVFHATSTTRSWAVGHSLLARYLIESAYADRELLKVLGFEHVTDCIQFRLKLLGDVLTKSALGRPVLRGFAMEIATQVLKLDRDGGNFEFFHHWRRVLDILEGMPDALWTSSRTFNHHVAISRRRIAIDDALFDISTEEIETARIRDRRLRICTSRNTAR